LFWDLFKSILFRIDAESVHRFIFAMLRLLIRIHPRTLRIVAGPSPQSISEPIIFGIPFRSRVGLAAGMDKDAEIIEGLPYLGFGFAEIGTVTPKPQPGNDRPRLFRNPSDLSLFNRMGFNGLGATLVSERLREAKPKLPSRFRVGVNIGKNKETALEDAAGDYRRAIEPFEGLADYVVINVSSPNTAGLRSLQSLNALQPLVEAVGNVISRWKCVPPLLLKLAPELETETLAHLIPACESWGVGGWVLTNTLAGSFREFSGGWSGHILSPKSSQALQTARGITRRPIISVGGIMSVEEARKRIELGADLVQIYTGWVYRGPRFPAQITRAIEKA
jgi:dihydroorotate dehydrogenase